MNNAKKEEVESVKIVGTYNSDEELADVDSSLQDIQPGLNNIDGKEHVVSITSSTVQSSMVKLYFRSDNYHPSHKFICKDQVDLSAH